MDPNVQFDTEQLRASGYVQSTGKKPKYSKKVRLILAAIVLANIIFISLILSKSDLVKPKYDPLKANQEAVAQYKKTHPNGL